MSQGYRDLAATRFADNLKALRDTEVALNAYNDRILNPDLYCACTSEKKCYLHGVQIQAGLDAVESLRRWLVEARR